MFDDARNLAAGTRLECDLVIVGSGAAGATLASEFIGSGLDVIVLEGGGEKFEPNTQELYRGAVDDPAHHGALDGYRRRMFGGTTTVWGGRCAPFDPIDFEERAYVPHSGWPVTRAELDPYYARAHAYAHAGQYSYETARSLPNAPAELIPGLVSDTVLQDRHWRFSLPTDFGRSNRARLESATNVRVVFHANVLKIATDTAGKTVTELRVSSLARNEFTVRARRYVLATGGLESTRLLLLSDEANPAGLGNEHDLLGRFYSSHMTGDLGEVTFTPRDRAIVWDYERGPDGVYCKRHLRIAEETQRRLGLLNFRCILSHPSFGDPSHGSGVLSAAYLVKRFLTHQIPPEYSREMASREYQRVREHLTNVVLDSPGLVRFGAHWLFRRILARRKFPSIALRSAANTYTIHFDAEQAPNPASRVLLGEERDLFGLRRLRVEWRCLDLDIDSVARCHQLLTDALTQNGVARVHLPASEVAAMTRDRVGVGSHHIGTTRMADDPQRGVVDRHCRVHAVDNLYISSPSVFCTAGYANPVLTTVAFALRLADHLRGLQRP